MQNHLTTQPLLEISLLGRFQAKTDGVPVDEKCWVRRSAKSLVKLLALKPFHALHREQIMDLLWAEYEPETASNNLNKAIHSARRTLEPNLTKGCHSRFILTQKNQIILASPDSLSVDLDEFEKLANYAIRNNDLEAGQKAIELYRGDLLTEDIYEDWIFTRRESMRILFRKTATKTAELHAAQNNLTASIGILKKLIAEDATDEHIQRLLMRFYAETGSKYQALKQFEHCRAALHNLGIEPEPETIKLEQSIKRGEIIPSKNESNFDSFKSAVPIVSTPHITQLTFQTGIIRSANFLSDGKTIVFSAAWDGGTGELYTMLLENGEINRPGIADTEVFAISSSGEMAVGLNHKTYFRGYFSSATLAKLPLSGEAPCEIANGVQWADWHPSKIADSSRPDENYLAVVRDYEGKNCLEYPIGNVIYETGGWISHPRFSPDGKKIAFIEHPLPFDDRGFVAFLDLEDKRGKGKQILTDTRISVQGLAWLKDEIWFTASRQGNARVINAVNLKGIERPIYRGTGRLTLRDISENGAALVTDDKMRVRIGFCHADDGIERDLSWHDWSLLRYLTDDGKTLLFEEAGLSGGNEFSAYVRKIDGSSTKKIGDASALSLSPDGKYALLRYQIPHNHLALVSIDDGTIRPLETDPANSLIYQVFACFFPDGKRILFTAHDKSGERQIYTQNIDGGKPVRFAVDRGVEMLSAHNISPDGKYLILNDSEKRLALHQTSDGKSIPLKNMEKDFYLARWCGDGENIFIWRRGEIPAVIYKYNLTSGTKEKWLELMPKEMLGVNQIVGVKLTPDGKTYAYNYKQELSDLYLMEDLK